MRTHGGPFGMADPDFSCPQFRQTVFPGYVRFDGNGGLIWSFANGADIEGANDQRIGGVVRTLESGALDPNYVTGPALREALGTAQQADGKILVGATMAGDVAANGQANWRVFRLLTNGVVDTSYSSPVFNNPPRFMTVQPDGKLVIGAVDGSAGDLGNGGIATMARLNSDGSLDTTFTSPSLVQGSGYNSVFSPPLIDTNGNIYIAGSVIFVNGTGVQGIARLLPNGSLDTSFAPSGFTFISVIRGIVLQPGGKVVIGGAFRRTGDSTIYALLRLNFDGSLDNTFNLVSVDAAGFIRTRLLRTTSDGKILGISTTVARFNADGSLDNSFTRTPFSGGAFGGECYWFDLVESGKIVVPTSPIQVGGIPVNGAFMLNADGTLYSNFTPPTFQSAVYPTECIVQTGGRPLVWGLFDRVGGTPKQPLTPKRALARFNPDGSLDPTYSFDAFTNLLSVSTAAPAPDGSLYAVITRGTDPVFDFTSSLVHITAGGQLDTNFQPAVDFSSSPFVQDGKPIVWRNTEQDVVDGSFPFARLNTNGSVDASFIGFPGALGTVQRDAGGTITNVIVGAGQLLASLPGGKLLGAGTSDAVNYGIVRFNNDGTFDASFVSLSAPGGVPTSGSAFITDPQNSQSYSVAATYAGPSPFKAAQVLANGSMLVAGSFRGQNIAGLARLHPDGTLDPSFPGGSGAALSSNPARAARVDSVQFDSQGRIWITGNFDRFNGVSVKGIARLSTNGVVDTSFVSQASYYDSYYDAELAFTRASNLALNSDGSVWTLGTFGLAADTWPCALNRLIEYPPPMLTPLRYSANSGFWFSADLVEGQPYHLQVSTNLHDWDDLLYLTGSSSPLQIGDLRARTLPRRFYRLAVP